MDPLNRLIWARSVPVPETRILMRIRRRAEGKVSACGTPVFVREPFRFSRSYENRLMANTFHLPDQFEEKLGIRIKNARERLAEARDIGLKLVDDGLPLTSNPDHFAVFTDPPRLLNGPLKRLGYIAGADNRCYPSPVDGCDYINVAASLPRTSMLREQGWPDHVAVVHPVDDVACERMLEQGYEIRSSITSLWASLHQRSTRVARLESQSC